MTPEQRSRVPSVPVCVCMCVCVYVTQVYSGGMVEGVKEPENKK